MLLPARLRGPGPRALVGSHRALPHAVRRGQHPGRQRDDCGAVLPPAAPPGASRGPQAARASSRPSRCCGPSESAVAGRRAHDGLVRGGARRPGRRPTRPRCGASSSARARSPTTPWPHRDDARRARRGRAGRAALPVPAASSCSTMLAPVPNAHVRSCGCRRSPRTWARGASCRTAAHEIDGRGLQDAPGVAASSRAARPPARRAIHAQELTDLLDGPSPASEPQPSPSGEADDGSSSASACRGRQHLDRRHAHGACRLEVDAEVVEEHASLGSISSELARDLVEARVGLAHADLARLDDHVEQGHHLGDLLLAIDVPPVSVTKLLVRHAGLQASPSSGAPPRPSRDAARRRAGASTSARIDARVPPPPPRPRTASQNSSRVDLVALEPRPRVGVGVRGVEPRG